MAYFDLSLLTRQPRPTFLVQLSETVNPELPRIKEMDLFKEAARLGDPVVNFTDLVCCGFRGVSWGRLATVLATGIDVEPPDATIYVDGFDKALEYGGWPKVIVALRNHCLDSTFREISATTPEEELADLQRVFGTKLQSADGAKLWLSRLSADDSRITTDYEVAYARWIPQDALQALAAVFVLIHPLCGGSQAVHEFPGWA